MPIFFFVAVITLPAATAVAAPLRSSVSEPEAQNLFLEMARDERVPFAFLDFGCERRAHFVNLFLDSKGINSRKVWFKGDVFVVIQKDGVIESASWPTHIAAVVEVKTQFGTEPFVIDPTLFDRAVRATVWIDWLRANLKSGEGKYQFTSKYVAQLTDVHVLPNGGWEYRPRNLSVQAYNQADSDYMAIILAETRETLAQRQKSRTDPQVRERSRKYVLDWCTSLKFVPASCRLLTSRE